MLMTMTRRTQQSLGMSLVELMIVVVIIGILAAISMVGYRKYVARARLSEATAMLAEFAAKEQLFFLENGQYLEAHALPTTPVYLSTNENAGEFWPQNPSGALFDSARTPQLTAPLPTSWLALGVRPRWQQLFCTYMVNAGGSGDVVPGTVGPTLWPSAPNGRPNVPWFYAMAVCNLGGAAGWPVTPAAQAIPVTVMILTHDSPAIRTIDETF
jgi:prepilin-type N-terminal cleavage/methylation domain-containing protein